MADNGATQSLEGRPAAAAVLARGGSNGEAAVAAGVGESTVRRWRRAGDFEALVESMRQEAVDSTAKALAEGASLMAAEVGASVRALAEIRDLKANGPQARRGAAKDLLTLALDFRAHAELETRLNELEAAMKSVKEAEEHWRSRRV